MRLSLSRYNSYSRHDAFARPKAAFRGDIEGLRAIAVIAVVLYHYGVPGVSGGFVGVDIFFVISGYLISGLLLTELAGDGRINLLRFYGRRARRLLPAAFAVTIAVIVSGAFILSPLEQLPVAKAGAASSLYVSNFWFLRRAFDYFAPESALNPFLHTWSLSVEEQFYIIWPTLLILAGNPKSLSAVASHCDSRLDALLICAVFMAYPNGATLGILLLTNAGMGVWARRISDFSSGNSVGGELENGACYRLGWGVVTVHILPGDQRGFTLPRPRCVAACRRYRLHFDKRSQSGLEGTCPFAENKTTAVVRGALVLNLPVALADHRLCDDRRASLIFLGPSRLRLVDACVRGGELPTARTANPMESLARHRGHSFSLFGGGIHCGRCVSGNRC